MENINFIYGLSNMDIAIKKLVKHILIIMGINLKYMPKIKLWYFDEDIHIASYTATIHTIKVDITKIDSVDDKLTRILSVINKFGSALLANDRKIDDLRQEFEKRNPSEQEMLNIRSQASYPYSESPKDYWDNKKAQNPHYNVIYDNDVSTSDEQKQFDITRDDVRNINVNEIGKSFDINDFKLDDFIKI